MKNIISAKYLKDYKIEVAFDDGKKGVVDLAQVLEKDNRKIFKELLDQKKFCKFKVAADTIVWSNGLDLAPEFLYGIVR
jgi:hypothetical protein